MLKQPPIKTPQPSFGGFYGSIFPIIENQDLYRMAFKRPYLEFPEW